MDRTPQAGSRALRRAVAVLLAVLWVGAGTEALVHAHTVAHSFCAEHGQLEDVAAPDHAERSPGTRITGSGGASHPDGCAHTAAVRQDLAAEAPPAGIELALPPRTAEPRPAAPVEVALSPRGPPTWRLAPKASPPSLA